MSVSGTHLGAVIAKLRLSHGMTQKQLASIIGVSHQAVSKWESGASLPDIDSLQALAQLFGMTVDQLINQQVEEDPYAGIRHAAGKTVKLAKSVTGAIANTVSGFVSSAAELCKNLSEEKNAEMTADQTSDTEEDTNEPSCEASEENTQEDRQNARLSLDALGQLAPFMSRDKVSQLLLETDEPMDAETIINFSPFLNRDALEQLVGRLDANELSLNDIIHLAPFLGKDSLFDLVCRHREELDVASLKELAPFLKKGMVDSLVDAVAHVKQAVTSENVEAFARKAQDKATTLFSQIKDTAKNIVSDVSKAAAKAYEEQENSDGTEFNSEAEPDIPEDDEASEEAPEDTEEDQ